MSGDAGRGPGRSPEAILALLRAEGATGLERVALRENRRTLWSLTRGGSTLNLHAAYAAAPDPILRAFAVVVREARHRSPGYRRARERVGAWPPVHRAMARIRSRRAGRSSAEGHRGGRGRCCATSVQRVYLRRLYRYLNRTRFGGRLPETVPLRLSNRFRSRLGHMVPDRAGGRPIVVEIALNVDLMLKCNASRRLDTLLHEMAHAADHLFDGGRGHGPTWRAWARRVGCAPRARCSGPLRRRPEGETTVTRVPALPRGWRTSTRCPRDRDPEGVSRGLEGGGRPPPRPRP